MLSETILKTKINFELNKISSYSSILENETLFRPLRDFEYLGREFFYNYLIPTGIMVVVNNY